MHVSATTFQRNHPCFPLPSSLALCHSYPSSFCAHLDLPVPPCPPQILMRHAVEDVKRLSLEMGGNAPLIVFDSANVKLAVAGTLAGKVRCSGQVGVASLYSESV